MSTYQEVYPRRKTLTVTENTLDENETTIESDGARFRLLQEIEEVVMKHTFNCTKRLTEITNQGEKLVP